MIHTCTEVGGLPCRPCVEAQARTALNQKPCQDCGYPFTQPAGACSLCPECGSSSGCS